jgi:hypothetical protein
MKYKIILSGLGLELVMGKISNTAYKYFKENNIEIEDYINESNIIKKIPKKFQPFPAEAWFECDNLVHLYNVRLDKNKNGLIIIEQDQKIIKKFKLNAEALEKEGIIVHMIDEIYICEQPSNSYIFMGISNEKGVFFESEFEDKKFEAKKLKIEIKDVEGITIISSVFYNNKKLESSELSTVGNSTEFCIAKGNS